MSARTDLTARLEATKPPVEPLVLSRTDIVRYAGAAGDFNPVHHSEPFARSLGYDGVFAMGLLPGGILAARAQAWCAPASLSEVAMRFSGLVHPDVEYRVVAEVRGPVADGRGVEIALRLEDVDGATRVGVTAVAGQEGA